jgi:PD-(D/E)XK nuclease superfamily
MEASVLPGRLMAELTNDFTWSKSRHEKFRDCLRAYYYQYYGSWGGWEAPAGSPVRELYVLKKLSSRWQWAGSVVHDALKEMLGRARATGKFRPLDELLARTRERARRQWSTSREKSYWREAARIEGLVEHEYAEPVPDAEWKRIWDEAIEGSLRAFYASDTFERIQRTPREKWLGVDELDSWIFEGVKIWVAVDFAFTDADGRIHILDWKTGREREVDHTQVGIYALYAHQKWGAAPEGVVGGLVYLSTPTGERVSVSADPAALDGCRDEMRRSIAAMQERLADPPRNLARLEAFPQLPEPASCRRCAFRRPCGRM